MGLLSGLKPYYTSTKDECEGVKFVTKVNDILDALYRALLPSSSDLESAACSLRALAATRSARTQPIFATRASPAPTQPPHPVPTPLRRLTVVSSEEKISFAQ